MRFDHPIALGLTTVALAASLVACGGGGSSSPTPGPTPASLTLSGVVASGAALAGAGVTATCASGSGTATSATSGAYSIALAAATLPCVLKAVSSDGNTVLHSVATTATANITPLTELLVAHLGGEAPETFFSSATPATLASAVTASAVASAEAAVTSTLSAAGQNVGAIGDFVTAPLVPASGATAGNAYDTALDTLATSLASSGTTLATLTTTVAATSPAAPQPGSTGAIPVSVAASMLLQPASPTCPSLHSGTYIAFNPTTTNTANTAANQIGLLTINATAGTFVNTAGQSSTLTPNGTCRFTTSGGGDLVVSQAGVIVGRSNIGSVASPSYSIAIAFPLQQHTVADLAGNWNAISLQTINPTNQHVTGYVGTTGNFTRSATGTISNVTWCENDTTWNVSGADCTARTGPFSVLSVDPSGGFDDADNLGDVSRVFAYQAGGGGWLVVEVDPDGSLYLFTPQRANPLPAVGGVSANWDVYAAAGYVSPIAIDSFQTTINSVNTSAGSWIRTRQATGSTVTWQESVTANDPTTGYEVRPAATVTASDGSSKVVNAFNNLPIQGMGINGVLLPSQKYFLVSVTQP